MHYMLDTNILIYIRRQRPPGVMEKFRALQAGSVCMSAITYGELSYGISKRPDPTSITALFQLTRLIPVVPLEPAVGLQYGGIRAELEAKGEIIGNNDLWIAAHARTLGLTLVTNNMREFARVPDLALENWV